MSDTLANAHRAEVKLDLGEPYGEVLLRPTFAALAKIEGALKEGIIPITRRFNFSEVGTRDVAVAVHQCQEAAGGKLKFEEVCEAVMASGMLKAVVTVSAMLTMALSAEGPNSPATTTQEKTT